MRFFNVSLQEVFGANRRFEFASISSYLRFGQARWLRVPAQERVSLPYRKPILSTYLYSAYPLGILRENAPVVLNANLQLYYRSDPHELHSSNSHLLEHFPLVTIEQYGQTGDLEIKEVVNEDEPTMPAQEVPALMASLLTKGCHVYAYVDLFFIPESHSFLRGHYRHEILVSGVDGQRGIYKAMHYSGSGQFKPVEIPIGLFSQAFVSTRAVKCSYEYCRKFRIASFQARADQGMKLDLRSIRAQMVASLNGVAVKSEEIGNPILAGWIDRCPHLYSRGVYGRAIYPYILRDWEGNFGAQSLDIRPSRLLLEHVRLMQVRLDFLTSSGLDDMKEVAQDWGQVVQLAQRIQLALVASKRKANRKNWDVINRYAGELIDAEERILTRAVKVIPIS